MSILGNVQRVLALFAAGATDLSFTEAATLLELPKSSTSHLLNQMVRYGLLDQHSTTRRYRPGALLGQAPHAAYVSSDFDDACREVLERLSARSGLTAYLSTLSGRETVVLQRLEPCIEHVHGGREGAAGRQELDPALGEGAREADEAGFVGDGEESATDGHGAAG